METTHSTRDAVRVEAAILSVSPAIPKLGAKNGAIRRCRNQELPFQALTLPNNARSLSRGAPADIAEREDKVGAGAGSIEPFQVSGWRGARKAASYGFSMVLFDESR